MSKDKPTEPKPNKEEASPPEKGQIDHGDNASFPDAYQTHDTHIGISHNNGDGHSLINPKPINKPIKKNKNEKADAGESIKPSLLPDLADDREGTLRSTKSAMSRIYKNVSWLTANKIIGAVLSLIYLGLLARSLGPSAFGRFAEIIALAQLIATLVKVESWQAMVKFGSDKDYIRDKRSFTDLIGASMLIDFMGLFLGLILATLIIFILGPALDWNDELQIYAFITTILMLLAVRSTPIGIMRLVDRFDLDATGETIVPLTRFIGILSIVGYYAFYDLNVDPSIFIPAALLVWGLSEILASGFFWAVAYRQTRQQTAPFRLRNAYALLRNSPYLIRFAITTNLVASLESFISRGPVILLGFFVSDIAAGYFRLAQQLATTLSKVANLYSRALFTELNRSRDKSALGGGVVVRSIVLKSTLLASLAAGGIFTGVYFFGEMILVLIADESFRGAYPIFAILAFAAAINIIGITFEPFMLTTDHIRATLFIRLVMLLLLLVLLAYALPFYGIIGTGYSIVIVTIVGAVARTYFVWKAFRLDAGLDKEKRRNRGKRRKDKIS